MPAVSEEEVPPSPSYSFISHALPPKDIANVAPLPKPFALPQLTRSLPGGVLSPFSRGYSEELEKRGIRQDEFLEFLDNLNFVFTDNKPLRILGLSGGILGFV